MILNIGFEKGISKKDILYILDAKSVIGNKNNEEFVNQKICREYCLENKEIKTYIVAVKEVPISEENKEKETDPMKREKRIVVYPSYIRSVHLMNR